MNFPDPANNLHLSIRDVIFISHAAPEDNEFSRWLSLQLIGMGFKVWCDVLKLKGGEDFWVGIEDQLRGKTVKFLYVLTKASNQREGTLKELAIAQKVKKQLQDDQYIIPLHIDPALSYDDVNIELNRLNSINFKKSWAEGLKNLIELFEELKVPKSSANYEAVNNLWRSIFLQDKEPLKKSEVYFSNWFPIKEIPSVLRFHKFKHTDNLNYNLLPFPVVPYRDYLATFAWCYDFINDLPQTATYSPSNTIEIATKAILNGSHDSRFIFNREAKNIIVQLLNKGFDRTIQKKPVSVYPMSNKVSFWIKKGVLEKDKFNKIQLIGKQKEKQWHFGISGSAKMFPERCFHINSHIWFTTDGHTLIPEPGKQHAARRKQGKNWWNNDWRNKTMAFMQFLAEEDGIIKIELGSEEWAHISMNPIMFTSPVTYIDPNSENLPEDDNSYEDELDQEYDSQIINENE